MSYGITGEGRPGSEEGGAGGGTDWMSTSEEGALRRIMVVSRYWVKKGSMLQFSARAGTIQRRARFSGGNGGVTELLLSNVGQEDFRPRAAAGDTCPQIGVLRRCEGAEKLSEKKRKKLFANRM